MDGLKGRINKLNQELTDGKISLHTWAQRFVSLLQEGHLEALELGFKRAGVFDYDTEKLARVASGITDEEAKFLTGYTDEHGVWHRGFLGDLKSGDDPRYFDEKGKLRRGSLDRRSSLYVDRMRGTANEGFVEGSPEESLFYWVLGAAEHCGDCPRLAAGSPYTVNTLPCFPGDGSTECRGNCQCSLRRADGMTGFGPY